MYVYLAVSTTVISLALIRKEGKVQKPIYYTNQALLDAETRYPMIEKLAYALVTLARKLRQYFQAHPIVVLTNQPLRQVL